MPALPLTLGCIAFCMFLTAGVGGVFWWCEEGTFSPEIARKGGEKAHEDAREVTADEDEDGAADEDGRARRSALDVDRLGRVAALSRPWSESVCARRERAGMLPGWAERW